MHEREHSDSLAHLCSAVQPTNLTLHDLCLLSEYCIRFLLLTFLRSRTVHKFLLAAPFPGRWPLSERAKDQTNERRTRERENEETNVMSQRANERATNIMATRREFMADESAHQAIPSSSVPSLTLQSFFSFVQRRLLLMRLILAAVAIIPVFLLGGPVCPAPAPHFLPPGRGRDIPLTPEGVAAENSCARSMETIARPTLSFNASRTFFPNRTPLYFRSCRILGNTVTSCPEVAI
jgi:hypothetical protein